MRRAPALALLAVLALSSCRSPMHVAEGSEGEAPAGTAGQQAPDRPDGTRVLPLPAPAPMEARVRAERRAVHAEAARMVAHDSAATFAYAPAPPPPRVRPPNTERYAAIDDNPVRRAAEDPVSTFSVDVDTGSYSNVRRMLRQGVRPPADAVRAEEFINYFDYGHPAPTSPDVPFRATTELAPAPWNPKRHLLMIGIKGYDVPKAALPPANLVFLLDTSGSMDAPDKLPLLKQSFAALVSQLRAQDRVSIVAYAGAAGLVLPPTPGNRGGEILAAIQRLQPAGGTDGSAGIELAYAMAKQAFVEGGSNRVILATDGDFNLGTVDQGALETLVADQRRHGIALTTLGFGHGNYNDALAERLADVGDGNHAYIDTLQEARKVLVEEMQSTLLTIARDVKVQVEFNPAIVADYRLVGYENRVLAREDFANDHVDAGDIGAGHEVTALYELTLVGSGAERIPPLRYGVAGPASDASASGELAHLRLRYKRPAEDTSRLIETPVPRASLRAAPSDTLRFAATVAAFADALRGGTHLERWGWDAIAAGARDARGPDRWRLREEFAELAGLARLLIGEPVVAEVAEAG
jgi:Ca-activated chloride channel homolog